MRLLIDLGNTALKWTNTETGRVDTVQVELHHGQAAQLEEHLARAWRGLSPVGPAFGCSVAAASLRDAVGRATAACGGSVEWLASQERYHGDFVLENGYRSPLQLGADRWHGMLGACERRAGHLVLIAAGTATTIDAVERHGEIARFVGGCIAPGTRLMMESLAQRTAGLPHAAGNAVGFPDNTDDAIATGVADAQTGLASQFIARFRRRLDQDAAVVVSGGDADALASRLQAVGISCAIEHNLVLAGLELRACTATRGSMQ
jgi:type III pantothenate kinase